MNVHELNKQARIIARSYIYSGEDFITSLVCTVILVYLVTVVALYYLDDDDDPELRNLAMRALPSIVIGLVLPIIYITVKRKML